MFKPSSTSKPWGLERNAASSELQMFLSPRKPEIQQQRRDEKVEGTGYLKTSFNDLEASHNPEPKGEEKEEVVEKKEM